MSPLLVDGENGVIAGHGRLLAARKLGLEKVPVIELAHLSAAQKRAHILAENKLAERAGWDREMPALEKACLTPPHDGRTADLRCARIAHRVIRRSAPSVG